MDFERASYALISNDLKTSPSAHYKKRTDNRSISQIITGKDTHMCRYREKIQGKKALVENISHFTFYQQLLRKCEETGES